MQQTAPEVDLDGLRGFVAVAESLSFIQAAELLGTSTSALTRRIQRFEAVLGIPCLERSTRHVALSQAGQILLPLAQQIIRDVNAAVELVRHSERDRAQHLTIAALPTVTAHLLPLIIQRFRLSSAKAHLRVIECGAAAVLQNVRDGSADLGFTFITGSESDLVFDPILDDPFSLIIPKDHPLASADVVKWMDLKNHAVITAGPKSGNMLLLNEALRGIEWRSETVYEVEHLTTSLGMVAAGLGIAVVPRSALPRNPAEGVLLRRLTEPQVSRTLGLFRRRNARLKPVAQQFLLTARTKAQDRY